MANSLNRTATGAIDHNHFAAEWRTLSALEVEGIKSLIKRWSGLEINLVPGGPSVADPMGLYKGYISFRDAYENAWAIGFDDDGRIQPYQGYENGKQTKF